MAIFIYGADMLLLGRTMEPRLSVYTFKMAWFMWALFAAIPTLSLLRTWQLKKGWMLLLIFPLVGFALACSVAQIEEQMFVKKHRASGIGPKPRWTASHHWLAYDKNTDRLYGSD